MEHSKGNWSVGTAKAGMGAVVTDNGEGFEDKTGHSDIEYYGGYLICESVAKQADRHLISAAPDMYEALAELIYFAPSEQDDSVKAAVNRAKSALRKAKGL